MNQRELLAYVIDLLERLEVPYGITGSHASMAFGESRLTNDIDVVVQLDSQTLSEFCKAFPAGDFYVNETGAEHAVRNGGMFNIIHPDSGLKVDVIVPSSAEGRSELDRTVRAKISPERDARFISPEDLVIHKLRFYREGGSEKHLRDIAGMLKILEDRIDVQRIGEAADLEGLSDIWAGIRSRLSK